MLAPAIYVSSAVNELLSHLRHTKLNSHGEGRPTLRDSVYIRVFRKKSPNRYFATSSNGSIKCGMPITCIAFERINVCAPLHHGLEEPRIFLVPGDAFHEAHVLKFSTSFEQYL